MIGDLYAPRPVQLEVTDQHLATLIEATHDALIKRVKWTVTRESHWANLEFETMQMCISLLAETYTLLVFTARDLPSDAFYPTFFDVFGVSSDMWEIINSITYGKSWEAVPVHPHMPGNPNRPACALCDSFEMA